MAPHGVPGCQLEQTGTEANRAVGSRNKDHGGAASVHAIGSLIAAPHVAPQEDLMRRRAAEARLVHTQEVAGSNPAAATNCPRLRGQPVREWHSASATAGREPGANALRVAGTTARHPGRLFRGTTHGRRPGTCNEAGAGAAGPRGVAPRGRRFRPPLVR